MTHPDGTGTVSGVRPHPSHARACARMRARVFSPRRPVEKAVQWRSSRDGSAGTVAALPWARMVSFPVSFPSTGVSGAPCALIQLASPGPVLRRHVRFIALATLPRAVAEQISLMRLPEVGGRVVFAIEEGPSSFDGRPVGAGLSASLFLNPPHLAGMRVPATVRQMVAATLQPTGLAMVTPQALSSGHGALHMDLGAEVALRFILLVFVVKTMASAVSLGFGFRGGLFFASLFIGSLAGQLFAGALAHISGAPPIDPSDAALIGMAAMAASIIGAPMTMSLLVLETTHDFALTGVAVTAALCASTVVRETFGFSFSTWRMHTRGQTIRGPRDVGWVRTLTVGKMMQRAADTVPAGTSVAEFRRRFPLGSKENVVLTDSTGAYFGIVDTARAFDAALDENVEVGTLAQMTGVALEPQQDVRQAMKIFDTYGADFLAVVNPEGEVIGTLSDKFVHRRYTDEMEKAQREMFGE